MTPRAGGGAVLAMLGPGLGAVLGAGGPALAQDASAPGGFQLPPGPSTSPDRPGPVDAENPVVRPSTPPPAVTFPTPTPTPTPAPSTAAPSPAPRTEPTGRPATGRAAPASPAPEVASPAPQEASPAPAAPSLPSAPATDAIAAPTVPAAPASPEARTTPDQRTWLWAALGAAAALLAGLGLWLRRAARPDEVADDAAKAPAAAPPPAPPAALPPMAPPAPPERALAAVAEGLDVTLEARELTGSLIYATLSYRLTVINHGPASTGPLAVAGDLVSAHAAIDSRAQLAPEASTLAPLHEAPPLAPGESAELSGALRMPLSAILPLAGGAAFVPLARFHITAPVENGAAFAQTRIFVVGPAGGMPGDALRPFRFDRFPGVVRDLGQREIPGSP